MPARPSPLRRALDKEKAAREQAEAQLFELRRRHPLELAAERADRARTERELRGQLRQLRAEAAEGQQQAATAAEALERARVDHGAELEALGEDHRGQLAGLEHDN